MMDKKELKKLWDNRKSVEELDKDRVYTCTRCEKTLAKEDTRICNRCHYGICDACWAGTLYEDDGTYSGDVCHDCVTEDDNPIKEEQDGLS